MEVKAESKRNGGGVVGTATPISPKYIPAESPAKIRRSWVHSNFNIDHIELLVNFYSNHTQVSSGILSLQ
jgi:hypothetical protein